MRYTSAGLVWAGPWDGPRGFGLGVAECNEGQSSCQGNTRIRRIRTSWIVGSPSLKACDGRVADIREQLPSSQSRIQFDLPQAGLWRIARVGTAESAVSTSSLLGNIA